MAITLTEYHDAVIAWLKTNEYLDWLVNAVIYPELRKPPAENSAYFGITDWEKSEDQKNTGELTMDLSCQLLVVFPQGTPDVQLMIREAVMSLCLELENQRFGLQAKALRLISAEPDAFNPELDECEVWSIRWIHQIDIGSVNSALIAEVFNPLGKAMVGYSPEIGTGHEPKYETVYDKTGE
ncbi:hypothetical protein [Vibrio diazotrophicus]|uniref:Phage tail protein n=1 Tax=Vibrio diazotrophicus TaxID=685 RepID=A0ABX4W6L0_VIBDI|nr:hypothetical protein [Vibrio diazotrophicus]PNH99235.1 hypothetical protein C1O25_17945 [Vibrio diazotrophicus]